MDLGLECFDANGNKILDDEWITAFKLGEHQTGTAQTGSFTDNNIQNRKVWVAVIPRGISLTGWLYAWPVFTISGNTISWQFKNASIYDTAVQNIQNMTFIYGVYADG